MIVLKKIFALFVLLITSATLMAQNDEVEMADKMRADGKIYVVVAVMLAILAGLVLYIIRIDRKLRKLEKEETMGNRQ